ncbi:MAG: AAA family ATPase [Leptospiraceae bacterium]|nr:AAA family ATPase [Leptospiraceae bacterium]MCP5495751.1 AAA family ATPase [Leptospiraceae bacterium]
MIKQDLEELRQKARTITIEEQKRIISKFSDNELLIHIQELYNRMEPNYLSEIDHLDKFIFLEKTDKAITISISILVYKGDVRAKSIQDVSIIETKFNELRRYSDKYILILIGYTSNEGKKRLSELKNHTVEIRDFDWLTEKFLEFSPEIFYDPKKISFLQNKIADLEYGHWLSKKGFNLSDTFTDPIVSTIEIQDIVAYHNEFINKKKLPFQTLKSFLDSNKKILIVGEPGCGKSSALAKLAIDSYQSCIKQISQNKDQIIFIPILLKASEFIKVLNKGDLYTYIPENVSEKIQIKSILIDGIDEVAIQERDSIIHRAVEIANELNISLILTTRTDQISNQSIQLLKRYDLLPFEFNQSLKLIQKILQGNTDFSKIKNIIIDSIHKLEKNLPLSPISIILLVELIENEKEIPASMVELYQKYLELVLGNIDSKKGLQVLFDYHIKEKFLSSLAFEEFFKKNRIDIPENDFYDFTENYKSKFESIGDINQFLDELKRSQILIIGHNVMFRHRTFLEYFVGLFINKNRDSDEFGRINDYLIRLYYSSQWSEVVLYYIGLNQEVKKEFLEKLFKYAEDNLELGLDKLMSGRLLQAGWQSESSIKEYGIENAIQYSDKFRNYIFNIISTKNTSQFSNLFFDIIILAFCEDSFSSTFLHRENNRVLDKILSNNINFSYIQAIGLFAANKRFLNYQDANKITYNILEKIENDKNLTVDDKTRYLISLDLIEREDKEIRRFIRKKIKKKLGKSFFQNPIRHLSKERKEIFMLEENTFIQSLKVSNFTCFKNLEVSFSPGMNFIIGENSSGKTHFLKILYSSISAINQTKNFAIQIKNELGEQMIAKELMEVFRPDSLNRLSSSEQTDIIIEIIKTDGLNNESLDFHYSFSKEDDKSAKIKLLDESNSFPSAIFIPVKEVLSFTTYFIDYYENHESDFDKTFYNLMKALSRAPIKKDSEKYKVIEPLLDSLKEIIGGNIIRKEHKFYLITNDGMERETSLIAEGYRKIAMLYYLILTDNLKKGDILFWDEPDSSLNPKLIVSLTKALISLVEMGIQVFVTSHNLFFMHEIDLHVKKLGEKFPTKFFSFVRKQSEVIVEEGRQLSELKTILSLDEALAQSDREEEILINKENSNDY